MSSRPTKKKRKMDKAAIPKQTVKISNSVCTTSLNTTLDLPDMTMKLLKYGLFFSPNKFPNVVIPKEGTCAKILLFNTGKLVCSGSRGKWEATNILMYVVRLLMKIGYNPRPGEFTMQNMVGSCDVGRFINLQGIIEDPKLNHLCRIERSLFPGLTMKFGKATANLFGSGKVVIMGRLRTPEEFEETRKLMCEMIAEHLQETPPPKEFKKNMVLDENIDSPWDLICVMQSL